MAPSLTWRHAFVRKRAYRHTWTRAHGEVRDSLVAGPRRVEGDGSEKGQRPSNEPLEVKAVAKP